MAATRPVPAAPAAVAEGVQELAGQIVRMTARLLAGELVRGRVATPV